MYQLPTMISEDHDNSALGEARGVQSEHQPAELGVNVRDRSVVVLPDHAVVSADADGRVSELQ